MRRQVHLVDTLEEAKKIRETFMAREARRETKMPFTWPSELQHIGKCLAVEYRSNKWHDAKEYEDYKHIAEAPQEFLACEDFLTPWDQRRTPLPTFGPWVELGMPMPRHFAMLAELLGVQVQVYVGEKGNRPYYGRGDDGVLQVRIAHCMLGGAKHPKNGRAFLFLYNPDRQDGVHAVITGGKLDIERDGIVG